MTHKDDLKEIVNRSITQTMSRSIFTSLTTFIMVAVLYILGVTSIRDFGCSDGGHYLWRVFLQSAWQAALVSFRIRFALRKKRNKGSFVIKLVNAI